MNNGELRDLDVDWNFYNGLNISEQSKYYSISEFNLLDARNSQPYLLNYNIRSFRKNFDSFSLFLSSLNKKPSMIVLTETWIKEDNAFFSNIAGYSVFHTFRGNNRRSGGVSIFIENYLSSSRIDEYCISDLIMESCVVNVKSSDENLIIFGIYKSHDCTIDEFSTRVLDILNNSYFSNKKIILTGDFNVNLLEDNARICEFICNFQSINFLSCISRPTRFANNLNNGTLLDHIWLNFTTEFLSGVLLVDDTDHLPTFIKLPKISNPKERIKIEFRLIEENSLEKIADELLNMDWSTALIAENIDDSFIFFSKFLDSLYCKYCPRKVRYVTTKRFKNPWISPEILRSSKTKSLYLKYFKQGLISREMYNRYRNSHNRNVRRTKDTYNTSYFNSYSNNPKKTWDGLKKLMNKEDKQNSIREIESNGECIDREEDISSAFNEFFSSIALNLDGNIPFSDVPPCSYVKRNRNTIFLKPTTPKECEKIIDGLKIVKYSIDTFPVILYKKFKYLLSLPISMLINLSLSSGLFPNSLKFARITPIFKTGDSKNVANYRPIAILPLLSKILEKTLTSRIIHFSNKYSIFSANQFGFLPKKSTCDAILKFTEYVYEAINQKKDTVALFLDLSRAFDTVNHSILLDKLELYGFRGCCLNLIRSYLANRSQCVRIGNSLSTTSITNIGVGQGSVIGPILFLLYINDLPNVSSNLKTLLYADDTTLYDSRSTSPDFISSINNDVDLIYEWFCSNRISVNLSKTYAMCFTTRRSEPSYENVIFNQNSLPFVGEGKFMGMHFDPKLNFSYHIAHVCKKISKTVGLFHKIFPSVPVSVRMNLYYTLFYPYLIYCNIIWGGTYKSNLNAIVLLQKKVLRLICGQSYLAHTNNLFFETKILKFHDIHQFILCLHFFNNSDLFSSHTHSYSTRNRNQIVPAFERLNLTQRSVKYAAPKAWNSLPPFLKNIQSYAKFKTQLKLYLVNKYAEPN